VRCAVGDDHTCAARAAGRVLCWGENRLAALGGGTTDDHIVPAPVSGL